MAIFFISDLHFGHTNILKARLQFKNTSDMDEYLINMWNETVNDDDEVYILGDFAYKNAKHISYYIYRLKGHKHLILGNHDEYWVKNTCDIKMWFETIDMLKTIEYKDIKLTLCHYPMLEWNESNKETSYMIHGHIHDNKNDIAYEIIRKHLPKLLNCGADINGYKPVTFEELVINNKRWYNNR